MTNAMSAYGTVQSKEILRESSRKIDISIPLDAAFIAIDSKLFSNSLAPGDVEDLNGQFIRVLDDIRLEVQAKGIDLTGAKHNYLTRLRNIGRAAYNKILPVDAHNYIKKLETKTADQNRKISLNFRIPPTLSLFWEMIYTGPPFDANPDHFWGFRCPIGRIYWNIEEEDMVRLREGVFTVIHNKLEHSKREFAEINKHVSKLSRDLGVCLKVKILDDMIPPGMLSTERLTELFHSDEFCYGLVHFACHHENPETGGATQACLCITSHEEELEIKLEEIIMWKEYGFYNHPLVFLNACGSATPGHLLQNTGFPFDMLGFGAAGVIATACTVPDHFAASFAAEFYRRLLAKPIAHTPLYISEILWQTRRYFLDKYNNPLGLAYSLHACSDQQLNIL